VSREQRAAKANYVRHSNSPNSYAMPQPELLVVRANEKFDTEGKLTDETTREHLRKFLEAFRAWTLQFKSSQS
jgi:hypothetical protein